MLNSLKARKIHSRNIEVSTFETDTDDLVVEGVLKDDFLISCYDTSGDKRPPNAIHHMVVRMLFETASFQIVDIEVEMPAFPHKGCDETAKSLDQIKGLKIVPGFTEKIKDMLGGAQSCSHLKTLVLSMASAAVQGFWVHRRKTRESGGNSTDLMHQYVVDTCWVWRKDGPLARRRLKEAGR